LQGKVPLLPVKGDRTWSRSTFSHRIGCPELFSKLMCSLEKLPKAWRIILIASTSFVFGLMKIAASSAYMEVLHFAAVRGNGVSIPC
jgi:hypothetical protein